MASELTFQPVQSGDEPFLFGLYASTRQAELTAWGWSPEQQTMFLKLQFTAQQRDYASRFPSAVHAIIYWAETPVGRWLVDYGSVEIRLVDISLDPAWHNRGIGTQLLEQLIAQATESQRPLRLSVLKTNPARRLYQRLGFVEVNLSGNDLYLTLEYRI